ncbi:MAG: hypothetical protein HN742_37400 [Lentisphaerae bacterium]|nr:hypothetical protein [Lentisphaerota bacterium]MBT4816499.1 hypothetical protein [Lentisphaerota bacterium]MBT5606083.1 hypothetical protein [Lentisphaerota bacterium]MBT7058642.1 hypothetical protein [Lentisphaerota bacterium]MBT7847605.1 hypothetical protein [Lentisphaerota bacterium]
MTATEPCRVGTKQPNPLLAGIANVEEMVRRLRDRVRRFVYQVVLLQKPCPNCGAASLKMMRDSWCRCDACGHECDPTLEFQRCPDCDGALARRRYHYWCPACRTAVVSRFTFDTTVFDPAYFREKMRESRERKRREREIMRTELAGARSSPYVHSEAPDLEAAPGLLNDLDRIIGIPMASPFLDVQGRPRFDLNRYRQHIRELIHGCIVHFDGIDALTSNRRLDRIYRFITVIFMEHDGEVTIDQRPDGAIVLTGI